MYYFAASTLGFYDSNLHQTGQVPLDAVEISEDDYKAFAGKKVTANPNGSPRLDTSPGIPLTPSRWISKWLFNLRFTIQERAAIYTSANPMVLVMREDFKIAPDPMNLDDLATAEFLDYFTSEGLLANGRKEEILT
jgi:hypothetical protein